MTDRAAELWALACAGHITAYEFRWYLWTGDDPAGGAGKAES